MQQFGTGTLTDRAQLLESIEETRKTGYTLSNSELENHTSAVAAPIFDASGEVIAGISIAGIEANYQDDNLEMLIAKVKKAASDISAQLGYIE